MSKIRVFKENDYSIISNPILRDDRLTPKARFVLLFCLSLADDWEYNIAGLSKAMGNIGIDATRSALQELEQYGYLVRSERKRNEKGQLDSTDYCFFECPKSGYTDRSLLKKSAKKPMLENPILETPTQYNIYNINNKVKEKDGKGAPKTSDCLRFFKENFKTPTPYEKRMLNSLEDTYGSERLLKAMADSCERGGKSIKYIKTNLERYQL